MTEQEKIILKKLSLTKEWQVVTKLVEDILEEIQHRTKMQDNEWDTIKSVVGDESEMRGVRRVIQEVHKAAKEAK
jgi:hypothetical protein